MSFGFKLLTWIIAINVVITGLLLWAILSNISAQSAGYRSNAERFQEQREEIIRRLEDILIFQKRMSEKELADVRPSSIIEWDEWYLCRDAMVLLNYTEIDGEIVNRDILLNPLGKHGRSFDDAQAIEVLQTAIDENRPVFHEDARNPELVFIAVPIFHRSELALPLGANMSQGRRPWGGALVQPKFPLFQEPRDFFNWELFWVATVGGTITLILVTIMILSKLVIRPVNQMAHVADLAAGGDYSVQCAPTGSRDEIGRLITSFNYMLHEVRDYHQHLEERIEEEQAKLKAAERHLLIAQRLAATGKLAAGIAHEINNPIGGMINAALNLKNRTAKEAGDGRVRVYIDLIVEGLERIKDIVRKVLVFTPRSLKPANVSLIDVLMDARDLLAFRLEKEEISLTISVDPEDLMIFCEPGELRQVFLNLFLNAMDAVEAGAGRIDVTGRTVDEGRKVAIEVRDNGCGMDSDALSRAFDLFYSTKEVGKGTGLGLSVAQNIVMNHGGIIEADSTVGRGTVIRIELPAR
jgi:signal transduction histidine kinase